MVSFLVPLLTIALVSALFLLGRLWYLRKRYLKTARSRPQDAVPTAGSIIGDVVGRDELCRVIIADLRDSGTRRPHVVVGGIGTGKTALLVRLTQLLAQQRAVPVAVRLRDAQDGLNFRELARRKFIGDLESSILSDIEGEKVWRQILKEGRIVVLADGLEEALIQPGADAERDNLIRLAIREADKDELPLIIASRPHNPLHGSGAALVELEPLSEEAALDYIQHRDPIEDEHRIDWIVETADVTETPLYLQIARRLHRAGLLVYVSANPKDRPLDTRDVDRAELRFRLLRTWEQALVNGHFPAGVALSREDREATVEQLSVLACIGLQHDTLEVKLKEFETLVTRSKKEHVPLIQEARKRLPGEGRSFDIRLAATWGTQLQLVEAQEGAVRFPHSILQAYLGSRLIGFAMADPQFRKRALRNAGRELLIALVMQSRGKPRQRGASQTVQPKGSQPFFAGTTTAAASRTSPGPAAPGAPGAAPEGLQPSASGDGGPGPGTARPVGDDADGTDAGDSPTPAEARDLRKVLCKAARKHKDAKGLNLYATALEIDSVDPAPMHPSIALEIAANWRQKEEQDPRTLEQAKLNLVRRFGDAARAIAQRGDATNHAATPGIGPCADAEKNQRSGNRAGPAYKQIFEIACYESSYPVRLAAAQEIGAGGDPALEELASLLTLVHPTQEGQADGQTGAADGQAGALGGGAGAPGGRAGASGGLARIADGPQPEQREDNRQEEEEEEETQRKNIMRAWVVPMLVGSVTSSHSEEAKRLLRELLGFVHGQNQRPDRERSGLSIEIALAQGFKYAANRRREHPQARDDARAHLREQTKEMLDACRFWFTRLTLIQALTLWHLPDDANGRPGFQPKPDYKALVAHWSGAQSHRRRGSRNEHPFVAEACRLAVRALETGRPERYMWIDESGVVSRVGSSPAKPHSRRKHNLWIPPSTGWTALNARAQQLVADVLLLLNLAERGRPLDRDRRLLHTNANHLPPCIAEDRSPLDPGRLLGMAGDFDPGSNCKEACQFGLCPYPSKGQQYYRQELSEAFCRRQQRLLTSWPFRPAPWQEMPARWLRQFWRELGQPVSRAELEPDASGRTERRDRRR